MEFEITSTVFRETRDFVEEYKKKLAPYHLKIKNNRAYIKVTSIQKLVDLQKLVDREIVIGRGVIDGSVFLEIYDGYRE